MQLPDLPVQQALPELRRALSENHAVLGAPPGSGKTTIVPLALLNEPWLQGQKILMLEPRRPAARMAARRLAQLAGEEPGGLVGYQVRLERKIGRHSRLEVITEGILTRRLQNDPSLEGVGLVIFDEFHERNLQADLGLALTLDACSALREDLRVLVMSATLDAAPLCHLLDAPHVEASGRQYPVDVVYLPPQDKREPLQAMPGLVRQALRESQGDVLVFLPGRGEIERLAEAIKGDCDAHEASVQKLFGDLPAKEQDRILMPPAGSGRRVILSTDIAESSVTIEGVGCVVDSGLARKPQFDPNSGMTRLQRQPIARASADQRAGRAGRLGPGICYRAWSEARHARLLAAAPPELATSELSGLVLELAQWGVTDPNDLSWLDAPPSAHWQQAVDLLQQLDVLDPAGKLTPMGRRMADFGVEPRLARLLVSASSREEAQTASDLAALLGERDPFNGPQARSSNLESRLQLLADARAGKASSGADRHRVANIQKLSKSLYQQAQRTQNNESTRSAAELLALAFPDRIARRRENDPSRYLLANGRGAMLDEADALAGSGWLVIAALDAGQREGRIWSALPIDEAAVREAQAGHIESREELVWDEKRQGVVARQHQALGAITLAESLSRPQDLAAAQQLLMERLRKNWPAGLPWDEAAVQYRERARRMHELFLDADWPDMSDEALSANLEQWLAPWMGDKLRIAQLAELNLSECLKGYLSWEQQQQLESALPSHYVTPAGSRRRIDYQTEGAPRVAVPMPEVFGQSETPLLADGRQPLVLELLNPAGRPIQVTGDLANFWSGAYVEVRKELRGRYPKHDWPERPGEAKARQGTGRPRRR